MSPTANRADNASLQARLLLYYLLLGFGLTEVFWASYHLGYGLGSAIDSTWGDMHMLWLLLLLLLLLPTATVAASLYFRSHAERVTYFLKSRRYDLLLFLLLGVYLQRVVDPALLPLHLWLQSRDIGFACFTLVSSCALLLTISITSNRGSSISAHTSTLIKDEPIKGIADDQLNMADQAKQFAESVWENRAQSGLIWGIDGEWGVGKSSFLALASAHWRGKEQLIVCEIDTLRYYKRESFISEFVLALSDAIQQHTFVPELQSLLPAYAKQVAGSIGTQFGGLTISPEDAAPTPNQTLDKIQAVLRQTRLHLIIIVDDLDRLDPIEVNQILYATRCTLKLDRATYVLSFDSEVLIKDENSRQFIEKFVTLKLNILSPFAGVIEYLNGGWEKDLRHDKQTKSLLGIPRNKANYLGKWLAALAENMGEADGRRYLPVLGNLRQAKRLVNALTIQLREVSLAQLADFHPLDVVHLTLLLLNYPVVFREIYAQEATGQSGIFSIKRSANKKCINHDRFKPYVTQLDEDKLGAASHLVTQLFDAKVLKIRNLFDPEFKAFAQSRACFNDHRYSNLPKYFEYVLRFSAPESEETHTHYQQAITAYMSGAEEITPLFEKHGLLSQARRAKFWEHLADPSHQLRDTQLQQAVGALIDDLHLLPLRSGMFSPRKTHTLLLLDILGNSAFLRDSRETSAKELAGLFNVASFILGTGDFANNGVIHLLAPSAAEAGSASGAARWFDLMAFRLWILDRRGYASIRLEFSKHTHGNERPRDEATSFDPNRQLSQAIFALFKAQFVHPNINFYDAVDKISSSDLEGEPSVQLTEKQGAATPGSGSDARVEDTELNSMRQQIKAFVMYQLCQDQPKNDQPMGVGYFAESGNEENLEGRGVKRISQIMNDYVFKVCFNPEINQDNIAHFLEHALSRHKEWDFGPPDLLTRVAAGFSKEALIDYWKAHGAAIRDYAEQRPTKSVFINRRSLEYGSVTQELFDHLDAEVSKGDTQALPTHQ